MRIAVIGAGIFGVTVASKAARAGYKVDLFDTKRGPMKGASWCNQFRLHRGYHYPRSPKTGWECRIGNHGFFEEYGEAIIPCSPYGQERHYYAIARAGSLTSVKKYRSFLDEAGLWNRPVTNSPLFNRHEIRFAMLADEGRIDPIIMLRLMKEKLSHRNITCHWSREFPYAEKNDYDRIVVACYASGEAVLKNLGQTPSKRLYEVVEKPLISLPPRFEKTSVVIMDGPFSSVDPYGRSSLHLFGHAKYALHEEFIGIEPNIPAWLKGMIDVGCVGHDDPGLREYSKFGKMIDDAKRYLPFLDHAEHVGSMFTVRAVLPHEDETDKRPTLVRRHGNHRIYSIFSGKISTCVKAADQVLSRFEKAVA